jgi:uncharacterized Fe-S cluster-containing radical SAM superfamily protein
MKDKAVLLHVGSDFPRWEEQFPQIPPLGILALGSYLAEHGAPVELIDVQMDFGFGLNAASERVIAERVARYLQDQVNSIAWVGISQLSNTASGIGLAQEIRTALPETPIILGGYFASCSYQLLLREHPFITAIVRGDGEAAALQISRSLAQGQSFLCDQTPNLAWLSGGEIHTTPIQTMDLNTLPILDFRLLRNRAYYQTGSIMTSRGCPFRCNYCTESRMRPYAAYPTEWVARQLEHMEAEMQCRHIVISDPIFGVGNERTRELCQVMGQYHCAYGVETRVDVLSPDLIPTLRQAGVEIIFLGIESGSPATLVRMNKVRSKIEAERYLQDTLKVLRACFENNIVPSVGLMLGFPGDTETDLQATLEFVKTVSQLHDQVAAQTGVETGLIVFAQTTQIYDDTPLAGQLTNDFQVALVGKYEGEKTVSSPSPELSIDTIRAYESEINIHGRYVPAMDEIISQYIYFSGKNFAEAHPELTDDEGVIILCDQIRAS